ncbi:hypothetical protein Rsub_04284 [Raphidocelis subcapitata]|uniref:AN1-type domain-containing protein n=1 Tax=Raphidocelis subcapitata TaxID=307507 RepID=A0A2V0NV82_9CHLO|nr:hypothetical protein Rsub_04284 [Raphidocelis subcapitata]|eukprot:GBF91544.1 hypothetical protein Rsub_04284 [Raphidocelis subcapitata]
MSSPALVEAEADLLGLGEHCRHPECRTLDFLPFKCDACKQIYCLDHRTYSAHACKAASASRQLLVIVCPLCAGSVHLGPGESPDAAFDRHCAAGGCDPRNYARATQKPRCPARGCKEKLTTINTYACKACHQRVCMRHRMTDDHQCPGRPAAGAGAGATAAAKRHAAAAAASVAGLAARVGRGASAAAAAAAASATAADPTNSVHATAARRRQALEQQRQQEAAARAANGGGWLSQLWPPQAASGSQQQQQQGRRQPDAVIDLTGDGGTPPPSRPPPPPAAPQQLTAAASAGFEFACHRCGAGFHDAVQLVEHDSRCAAGTAARGANCRLS